MATDEGTGGRTDGTQSASDAVGTGSPDTYGTVTDTTDHGRTLANAPWRTWALPYGAVVIVLTLVWMLLPAGWLWLPLAAVAGFFIARLTWPLATRPSVGRGR